MSPHRQATSTQALLLRRPPSLRVVSFHCHRNARTERARMMTTRTMTTKTQHNSAPNTQPHTNTHSHPLLGPFETPVVDRRQRVARAFARPSSPWTRRRRRRCRKNRAPRRQTSRGFYPANKTLMLQSVLETFGRVFMCIIRVCSLPSNV